MTAAAPGERVARCRCGQLSATCRGEPVRVSVCHCRACQRRTGGPFSAQARFPADAVAIAGEYRLREAVGGSGRRTTFRWCPECGGEIAFANEGLDNLAIPLGAFAPEPLPVPALSIHEEGRQPWIAIVGEGVEHYD